MNFIDLRTKFLAEGSSSQYMAKIAANSLYGILFEAVDTYYEKEIKTENNTDFGIFKAGYRAGEFWNPLYASIITSETRILMSKAANAIEQNGGKVIIMMTDSLFWEGKPNMIPSDIIKEKKTLGYFEKVEKVTDIVCLGSGRYGYKAKGDYYVSKKRGLNSAVIHDPNGIDLTDFNWHEALTLMERNNTDQLEMDTRALVSPGKILHDSRYTWHDLGRVVNELKVVDAIVGKNKRFYEDILKNPKVLAKKLVNTHPIRLLPHMLGNGIVDQTLPELRKEMIKRDIVTKREKTRKTTNKRVLKHYHSSDSVKDEKRKKYQLLKSYGYNRNDCKRMSTWSMDRIRSFLFSQGI